MWCIWGWCVSENGRHSKQKQTNKQKKANIALTAVAGHGEGGSVDDNALVGGVGHVLVLSVGVAVRAVGEGPAQISKYKHYLSTFSSRMVFCIPVYNNEAKYSIAKGTLNLLCDAGGDRDLGRGVSGAHQLRIHGHASLQQGVGGQRAVVTLGLQVRGTGLDGAVLITIVLDNAAHAAIYKKIKFNGTQENGAKGLACVFAIAKTNNNLNYPESAGTYRQSHSQ